MIQVVLGKRGSGKSKRLIDLANEALKTEHGLVVFVDDDKNNMYDLRHEVRLVDASEFALGEYRSASWFTGCWAACWRSTLTSRWCSSTPL